MDILSYLSIGFGVATLSVNIKSKALELFIEQLEEYGYE